jgi:hypothetical protein
MKKNAMLEKKNFKENRREMWGMSYLFIRPWVVAVADLCHLESIE